MASGSGSASPSRTASSAAWGGRPLRARPNGRKPVGAGGAVTLPRRDPPPRPNGLAPLLTSLVIGAILAGAGSTLAVDASRSALLDGASGASDASVAPTLDPPPPPLPPAVPTEPLLPTAAAPGATDGAAPGAEPGIPIRPPILPKAAPAGAGRPGAGPANAQGPPRSVRQAPGGTIAAVVAATNAERAAAGCRALQVDDRFSAAAQRHSVDMANRRNMSHSGGDGSKFTDRIRAAGYPRPGAENIAFGQPTAASVVADWMASAGHRRNILNCAYMAIGVGFDSRGNYWTQNFGF